MEVVDSHVHLYPGKIAGKVTSSLGARFFHETNLVRKGVALAAIVAGVALICLGKG